MEWEIVMGLEVHTELATKTKIFCGCSTEFGGEPNTHVCEICSGMPGTLPLLNKRVVEFAIRTGVATNCTITQNNKFDRKNYFYPDLPKAYQISQLYLPICRNGYIEVNTKDGEKKKIGIHEIHMEEDAGKLIHDEFEDCTLVDYNRCGVPLLEIVSEPDFRSAEEVIDYLSKLRAILQYTGVSDCKMQEGSLRADVNLSVRPKGQAEFGTRTEMKNLNSFHAIERAIAYEAQRQIELIEDGEKVVQETRRWDDNKGYSYAMRSKEDAQDYKYFPEPDLPPIEISDEQIEEIKSTMPELPEEKRERYLNELGLPEYDTGIITGDIALVKFFESTLEKCDSPKDVANWIMGEVMKLLNDSATLTENNPLKPEALAAVINMVKSNKINRGTGKKVLEKVFTDGVDPEKYVEENNLAQVTDLSALRPIIEQVIAENEKSVSEYKAGKTQAMGYIMGQAMRALKGKAPAQEVQKILKEILG
ncbi:MAG: Asp-tRNA(Asn)/Glu-tRNA(Gln) amidotransferase subunit GatB [Ruminococcus sp.]|jgi:aspartyl-tRNA(Asn)/glutamyl-tRNA(Gln) amidotransferase subunit B|nr:Asp-tRNA(Asn)/Glu-tRNA(Gln) amidotransferase subunit GatB [Ruminococcus sp.]MDD7344369.1 Asp-tRNA(Asn)/Glu-tRNA(Gln) amidotransferase subunit GatB [Ruminococcus sp.]MDY4909097.1 Asp-tRNA(Asn)/Glu-tRNA(Gln) amidotransferase subunit GatB [Candidatus Fimenecus sp.]